MALGWMGARIFDTGHARLYASSLSRVFITAIKQRHLASPVGDRASCIHHKYFGLNGGGWNMRARYWPCNRVVGNYVSLPGAKDV